MEKQNHKCTSKDHHDINAIYFCHNCQIYICNKCENMHSTLFPNHHLFNLEKDEIDLYQIYCKEEGHNMKLEYFCKTHNLLCCAGCISKIKNKNNGKHHDCEVFLFDDIKEEKLNKLNDNIKYLEDLSINLNDTINKLKESLEKINKNKEEIKLKIQQAFTKFKNELNNREDQLLLKVEQLFDEKYVNENMMREYIKLPNKIKLSLEKSKNIKKDNLDKNENILINQCISIENNIKEINTLKEKLINSKNFDKNDISKISFYPDKEEDYNNYFKQIQSFGFLQGDNAFEKSSIIKNNELQKKELLINWIRDKVKQQEIQFELIFKMKENGASSGDFHKLCDNKGPTLSLIKTTKNKIFGGFTPCNWKNGGGYEKDPTDATFLFSLNLNKKYDMINKNGNAIYCSQDYGINFGCADIRLEKNMKKGISYANSNCNFLSNKKLELTGGNGDSEGFDTEEFEVYKVMYNKNN